MKSNLDSQTPSNNPSPDPNQEDININENISINYGVDFKDLKKICIQGRMLLEREVQKKNSNSKLVDKLFSLLSTIYTTLDPEEQKSAFQNLKEIIQSEIGKTNPTFYKEKLNLLEYILKIFRSLFSKKTNKLQPPRPQLQSQNAKQTLRNDDLINDLIRLSQSSKDPTERASAAQLLAELRSQSSKNPAPQAQNISKPTNMVSESAYLQEDVNAHKNFIEKNLHRKIKECGGYGHCLILSILCQTLGEEFFDSLSPDGKFELAVDLRKQFAEEQRKKFDEDSLKSISSPDKPDPENSKRIIKELTSINPQTQSGHYLAAGDIAEVVARMYNRPFVELDATTTPGIATVTYPDRRTEMIDLKTSSLPQNSIVVFRSGIGGYSHYRAVI